jgi:hypothetical protein
MLGKTIGAGSMGKVKLARKEDGSEQVCYRLFLNLKSFTFHASSYHSDIRIACPSCLGRNDALLHIHNPNGTQLIRSHVKLSLVARPTMAISLVLTRNAPINPRKFELPVKPLSVPF